MFQLHQVSLKGIVESIFECDKFRYLLKSVDELYKDSDTYLGILLASECTDNEIASLKRK